MAKYRRYRKYSRRKHAKWSSNIQRISENYPGVPSGVQGNSITICQNPFQNTQTVSQTFTVKNVEIAAQLELFNLSTPANVDNVEYYILYVPQGYGISVDLPFEHPEWIMAYKFIGTGLSTTSLTDSNSQVPKIKTRLSRNLNTGDSIIFLYTFNNKNNDNVNVKINGLVRWWTKAN